MNSANSQYQGNEGLKSKMWDLMKSGDIPEGFISGYENVLCRVTSSIIRYTSIFLGYSTLSLHHHIIFLMYKNRNKYRNK